MIQAKSVSRKHPQRRFEKLEERHLLAAHFIDFDVLEPSDYTHTEVLVRFNDDVEVDALKKWTGTDLPDERSAVLNAPLGKGFRADSQLWEIPVLPGQSVEDLIRHYNSLDIVDFAEPNYRMQAAAVPNDDLYGALWGMRDIGAESAWDTRTDSSPIIVGVIDSGVDYTHPDLVDNMWTNPGEIAGNGLDDDGNGYIDDVFGYDFESDDADPMDDNPTTIGGGHGTHVAGTIGARGNNNIGVAGVGWNASLMALKVIGQGGSADIARSIDYATDNGAKITNNSYGSHGTGIGVSQAISNAVGRAKNAGVLFVAAAGNSRGSIPASDMDGNFNSWPAELSKVHDNVITVAATDPNGSFASYSHWGDESVQIAAPGSSIRSTVPGGGYGNSSGTSMASPIVAGAAALLWAERPDLTYLEIKDAILNTARPEHLTRVGRGVLDLGAAMDLITDGGNQNQAPVAVDDSASVAENSSVLISVLDNDSDPDGDPITIESFTQGIHGTVALSGTDLLYTPNANYHGADSFTYTINDGKGLTDVATVTLSIISVNEAPTANDDTASTLSTLPVSINVIDNDTDVDGVIVGSTVSLLTQPGNGSVTNNFDGTLTYTPVAGFSGTDSFSYTVRDDEDAESNVALVSIVVEQGQVLFEDSFEGFADAWTQDNQGDWFLSSQRATDGIYSLEVDGRANNATVELIEGVDISAYSKALLSFDWLIERGFDKGEYLTLDVSGDGGASWALDVRQLRGNESEENVWNPGYGVGESTRVDLSEWIESTDLKVRFRSSVSGSREDANVDNVKIWGVDLDNANNSPIAVDDSGQGFSTDEDNSFIIGDVLSNDSDPDVGDVISIESIDTSSLIGELLDLGGGDFRYDPAGKFDALAVGESTTDSFLYTITDGRGGSDTATVTIEITGVNDAPDAVDDLGTGFETEFETAFTTASVLSNDTDPDTSDTLTISEVDSSSLSGTLVDNGDGTFLYTPEAGFQGEESFSYTITDGNGGSDSASVTIKVNAPNEAPVAVDDNHSTNSGSSVTTNVIENDTDSDGVIVASTVTIVTQPSNGMLVNHGDGTVTYTPIGGFVGTDSYTYTVRDDDNAISNVATVTIEVTQPPSDQVLFYDSFEGFADQWTQDSQGDWFLSAQRATEGFFSLEVDGRASDATVEFVEGVDISGFSTVILSFDWLIERGFDRGEYLSLDISGDGGLSWTLDVMQLRGNESEENVWNPGYGPGESTSVNLAPWLGSTDLKVRFRSLVSASREDANVDNVKIVGSNFDPLMDGGSSSFSEFTSGGNQSQTGSAADFNSGDSSNTTFGSAASTGDGRSWLDQMTGGANGSRFENSADFIFNNWFNDHQDFNWLDDDFLTGGRLF